MSWQNRNGHNSIETILTFSLIFLFCLQLRKDEFTPEESAIRPIASGAFICHICYVLLHPGLFDPRKDELDREEQEARIVKLRAETKADDAEEKVVRVCFVSTMGSEE